MENKTQREMGGTLKVMQYRIINNHMSKYDYLFSNIMRLEGSVYNVDKGLEQRGIADVIERIITNCYKNHPVAAKFEKRSSKKSTEDYALLDTKTRHLVDIKSHDVNGTFCMPNLTSIEKLDKLYEQDIKLHYVIVKYSFVNGLLTLLYVNHCRPHNLPWSNLSIANLGLGQLQISNMHKFSIDRTISKKQWLNTYHHKIVDFKYKLLEKTIDAIKKWEEKCD